MLIQAWGELTKRYRDQANDYSKSAALAAGAALTEPGEPIDISSYLPYPPSDTRLLSPAIQQIVKDLMDAGKLPAAMIADIYNHKLLPKS